MISVYYSPRFLRSFQRIASAVQDEFRRRERIFRENPFDPKLRTHKLKGRPERSFLVTYHIRVIFLLDGDKALFINIGDHSIYRKKI